MKLLTSGHVKALADALADAFPSVNRLDELLHADVLGKSFDELTSRFVSLRDNSWEIASKALDEGWGSELLAAARDAQPDNAMLRALWASLPEGDDQVRVDDDRDDRPSLLCGRGFQWNEVCQCAPARQHHVIVISGAAGQDPVHFRDRIETWLGVEPRRSIVRVDWPKRPASRGAFFEALGDALDVDDALLAKTMADRLATHNLVLLHDCVDLAFDDDALVKYYTEWLPELVKDSANVSKLKCVQPIEWPLTQKSLLTRLFSSSEPGGDNEDGARDLIQRLAAGAAASLPVIALTELVNLTDDEVNSFVKTSGLTPRQQSLLLDQVRTAPPLPARIFKTIDTYWSQIEAAS